MFRHRLKLRLRRSVPYVILLVILAGGTGWYAYAREFGRRWREFVNNEIQKHGIPATVESVGFNPFAGLIGSNLNLYLDGTRKTLLASVNRIHLDIDVHQMLRQEQFVDSIDLRRANLFLPIDLGDPESEFLEIRNLNARVHFSEDGFEVSRAEGRAYGMNLRMRAKMKTNAPPSGKASADSVVARRKVLSSIINHFRQFEYEPGRRPTLELEFVGDMATPDKTKMTVALEANDFRKGNYSGKQLRMHLEMKEGDIHLRDLYVRDEAGEMHLEATIRTGRGEVEFLVESSVDLPALLPTLFPVPHLKEFVFYSAPKFSLTGRMKIGDWESLNLLGEMEVGRFGSRGIILEGLSFDFAYDKTRTYVRNIHLIHKTGEVKAHAYYEPGDLRFVLESDLDPTICIPFTGPAKGIRRYLKSWKFPKTPIVRAAGGGTSLEPKTWRYNGTALLGPSLHHGVEIDSVFTSFEFKDNRMTHKDLRLNRREGFATAKRLTWDFTSKLSTLEDVRGNLWPAEFCRIFGEKFARHLKPYGFKSPPSITLNGVVDKTPRGRTDLRVEVDAPGITEYKVISKSLPFENGKADLYFKGKHLSIKKVEARLFNGSLEGHGEIPLDGKTPYSAYIALKAINFPLLTKTYFDHDNTKGELTGHFEYTCLGSDATTLSGKGVAMIANGNIFSIPFLGPLSFLIKQVVPIRDVAHIVSREASATYTVENGVFRTKDFEAVAPLFKMTGGGSVDTVGDKLDLSMRFNIRGIPGVVLFPVSKLFEYGARGTLGDPKWKPKVLQGRRTKPAPPPRKRPSVQPPPAKPKKAPKPLLDRLLKKPD